MCKKFTSTLARPLGQALFLGYALFSFCGGRSGVVVSALDFRSEGRWFDARSLPSCCFLGQETYPRLSLSLHPDV